MSIEYTHALTTYDNPYNPFTEFSSWFTYDEVHGYHTCSLLDRIATSIYGLHDQVDDEMNERVLDQCIKYDFAGNYIKVRKDYKHKSRL